MGRTRPDAGALEPFVNHDRQSKPSLKHIQVYFRFSDRHLPGKSEGAAVARELVEAVEAAVADPRFLGQEAEVEFAPRAQIESFGDYQDDGTVFLPTEDRPDISKRLQSLRVSRYGLEWPYWNCLNASTSFIGPEVDEFKRILETKAKKAPKYTLGSLPLWLLLVCDALDDLVEQAQRVVRGVTPQELRGNDGLRQHVATQMSHVQAALDGLLVDRPRRRIIRASPLTNGATHATAD